MIRFLKLKIKNPFCLIGIHNWKYKREKHNVIDHPFGRENVRVLVRECKSCGHREHHILPTTNGNYKSWRSFDHINEDTTINYTEL
jgi:hypothetical protein